MSTVGCHNHWQDAIFTRFIISVPEFLIESKSKYKCEYYCNYTEQISGKDRGWFNPQALVEDEEDGGRGRDPTFQLAISNLSAGQRAIKLDYTPPNT